MDHWWQGSAVETAAAISRREIGALEVVESHLSRMDAVNAHVNAVTVRMDDEARRAARAADDALAAGAPVGPLHGVPVTIKENVDVAGQATTNGIPAFADNVASADSPVVAHLRNAGAIIIGRTNTPEFSFRWFTDNPLRGATLNPWNRDVTPGGSGGGGSAHWPWVSAASPMETTLAVPCATPPLPAALRPFARRWDVFRHSIHRRRQSAHPCFS